ncbi:hypothetical protein [Streptomyces coelicoflavus]|uniref:hypothetical protein n=1 Tax=Streptomyces coelicoflavus TaxID=285562 RepID=UPI002E27603E
MRLRQGQCADGAAAGAQDRGRPGVQVDKEPGKVIRAQVRGGILVGMIEPAAVDAPGIGRQHGVVDGQELGQRREGGSVHRGTDERDRPASSLLYHECFVAAAGTDAQRVLRNTPIRHR